MAKSNLPQIIKQVNKTPVFKTEIGTQRTMSNKQRTKNTRQFVVKVIRDS